MAARRDGNLSGLTYQKAVWGELAAKRGVGGHTVRYLLMGSRRQEFGMLGGCITGRPHRSQRIKTNDVFLAASGLK